MSDPQPAVTSAAFGFLADLGANNDRGWFEPRAEEFRRLLVEPLADVLATASAQLATGPWPVSGGARTIFRQLRDQRYARAEPYSTAVRALLTRTGTTPTREGCVHVEINGDGGFVGVGFHRPPAAMLAPIRRRILDEPDRWTEAVDAIRDAGVQLTDDRLTRMPRGFEPFANHRLTDDLRLRSIEYIVRLDRRDWIDGTVVERIVSTVRAGMPLLRFGNDAIGVERSPG